MPDNIDGAAVGTASSNTTSTTATADQILNASTIAGSASTSIGNLPWAVVLLPTTSAGHSGIGQNKHGLKEESWVFGFFADGENCQQPIIVGTIPRGSSSPFTQTPPSNYTTSYGTEISTSTGASTGSAPFVNQTQAIQTGFEVLMRPDTNFTKEQASGIIGNLIVESGLNPVAIAKNDNAKSSIHPDSIGIAQWNDLRAVGLKNFASSRGKDWTDLETQFEYIKYELLHSAHQANSLLLNSSDPVSAADAFCTYEKPAGYTSKYGCTFAGSITSRRNAAHNVYKNIGNIQKSADRGSGL